MPFFANPRPARALIGLFLMLMLLSGCAESAAGRFSSPTAVPSLTPQPTLQATATNTMLPTAPPVAKNNPLPAPLSLWITDALPDGFREKLELPESLALSDSPDEAGLQLHYVDGEARLEYLGQTRWYYALVSPFPTVDDGLPLDEVHAIWYQGPKKDSPLLLVSPATQRVLEDRWGKASRRSVKVIEADKLLETAWAQPNTWAIIPFEDLEPRWKMMRVAKDAPFDKARGTPYLFSVGYQLFGDPDSVESFRQQTGLDEVALPTNYDPGKLTTLTMTGVTALSRNIAARMEEKGLTYPARSIGDLLRAADLTHISNEVSFKTDCPEPRPDMRFCSQPEYIKLLEAVGADIIELTGNHNLDWGPEPYLQTLEMYAERGWLTYGGGANLQAAQQPLVVEHNGNRLVFLGCSPSGPQQVWADEETPGSAPCDMDLLEQAVRALRAEGALPIVTFQHVETDWYVPTLAQRMPDFRRMAEAGAVVVQGSQAHFPQTMTFAGDSFIHYGLGNLFFDQMEPKEIRQAFIDQHLFYDGRYLGVNLVTTMLEDSARPRPMTGAERKTFLEKVFSLSQWGEITQ